MRAMLPPVTIASWACTCGGTLRDLVRFEQGTQQKKRVGKTDLLLMGSRSIAPSF